MTRSRQPPLAQFDEVASRPPASSTRTRPSRRPGNGEQLDAGRAIWRTRTPIATKPRAFATASLGSRAERDALKARLAELEAQGPVGSNGESQGGPVTDRSPAEREGRVVPVSLSRPRRCLSEAVGERPDRKVGIRARLRQRMEAADMRQTQDQVRFMPQSGLPIRDGRDDRRSPARPPHGRRSIPSSRTARATSWPRLRQGDVAQGC